ncbi:MAG TPA: 4-hydroxythreonine-4-phosphate dehydrogenase PdxA [Caulobacteraceae bacterium]|jgi:4-hydroxythreonine-4-phosphate dehydrogenase|nr:4-hydroxythreonine-4-phosphate dehydrogenase PdxA [Caulobacteraceae bacterium]
MPPKIAISLGDPAGIGPEIAFKAAQDRRVLAACRPVLVGDRRALEVHGRACGFEPRINVVAPGGAADARGGGAVDLVHLDLFGDAPLRLGEVSALAGHAALDAARAAIDMAMKGEVAAVVACPQTETAIAMTGIAFDGYPTFVARCTGTPVEDAYLMLCFDDKRIVHTTLHVSLRRAIELITEDRVAQVLKATHDTLVEMGVASPRIAVAGLNPHAGEHGLFGDDEATIIEPAMARARAQGVRLEGPFGADVMFQRPGYDGFVVMFHDQGHIAAKLLATNRTAGLTIGTPILFSSVAHGSALDIAGTNRASAEAVVEAVLRLSAAARRRTERTAEPLHA